MYYKDHTLLLTPWTTAHSIVPWQRSMVLLVEEKIDVLEVHDEIVRSAHEEWLVPSVARLRRPIRAYKKGVKFSRVNVFTRDGFRCQYCGAHLPARDLNYDHVIPRIRGGRTVWENIVSSCYDCNTRKAGRTPEEARMVLRKKPARPPVLPMTTPQWPADRVPEAWRPWLGGQSSGWATEGVQAVAAGALDVATV